MENYPTIGWCGRATARRTAVTFSGRIRSLFPVKKLTAFAMTKKGLSVVTAIHSKYPEMIAAVISTPDSGMAEDCYEDIRTFC